MELSPLTATTQTEPVSDRIAAINAVTSGDEFFDCLQAIPPGRSGSSQGYTYNRFIKVLYGEGMLPPQYSDMNYGAMKVAQKTFIHTTIRGLSIEVHGAKLFESLKGSILISYVVSPVIVPEITEGVVVNRWALMAEFYVHPLSREGLESYSQKIPSDGKNHILTDGMKSHRLSQLTELMRTCVEDIAPCISNCFGERWPALLNIHPEKGTFNDVEQFSALLTEMKNTFDILKSNLSMSGTQESGEILDGTALHFCKYGQRTAKLNHFYLWLCWKDQDLNFLSNNLLEGVATGGGAVPEPYTRSTISSSESTGSSVKSSYADRKSAKGMHMEKVAITIGEVLKTSLGPLLQDRSGTSEQNSSRSEAIRLRDNEQILNLKLKRQREAIEAPSYSLLSSSLQTKLRECYENTLSECNQ